MTQGPEKLIAKVNKVADAPVQAIEDQQTQAVIADLQKRLNTEKNAILQGQQLTPQFVEEMKKKIQTHILDKTPFTIAESDIHNGNGYVLYYTASDGKVYKSSVEEKSLKDHNFVQNALGTSLQWIFLQQIELIKQAKTAGTKIDSTLEQQYNDFTALDAEGQLQYLKDYAEKQKLTFEVDRTIQNELDAVQNEILKSLGSVDDLVKEVTSFSGDATSYDALVVKLQQTIKLRERDCSTLSGAAATKCHQEIETIKILLDKTLPEKYITYMTDKYITPNTPKPDKDPQVLRDIEHVLTLIENKLNDATLSLSPELRHQRTQKQESLKNVKEQFERTTEEQNAKRLLQRYEDATNALTNGLRNLSAVGIKARNDEYKLQKSELLKAYDAYKEKESNVSEVTSTALVAYKANFESLDKVFEAYTARKPEQDKLNDLQTKRQQILDRGELKKNGEPKDKEDRNEMKEIDKQIIAQRKAIEPFYTAVNNAEIAVGVLPTVPTVSPSVETTPGKTEKPYTTPENKVAGFDDIPEVQKKQLTEQYFGKGAAGMGMDRWKMRCACNPRHQEFLIAYQKIALQDFTGDTSRAETLKKVVKERTKFDDAELGSVRDFRLLLKNVKNQKDEEKDKYKYAKKLIPCLFEWAYYQQFNKKALGLVEAMEANRVGLSAVQPVPSFACAHEDAMISLMSSSSGGMGFWEAGRDLLSGIPGINVDAEMMKLISGCKVYKDMMKYIDPKALKDRRGISAHPYFYPNPLPGTSVDNKNPATNGIYIFNPDTQKYVLEGIGDPKMLLELYLQQWSSVDLSTSSLDKKNSIRDGKVANQLLIHWFSGGFDLKTMLEQGKIGNVTIAKNQTQEIMQQLMVDAMKYDDDIVMKIRQEYTYQINYYRHARQQHEGKEFPDQDINNIPEDEKYRMMSASAARAYANHYRLPNGHPRVEECLQDVYGGGWDVHKFVQNSNSIVGRNVGRLMNERKGDSTFAFSEMSLKDFNSIEAVVDQVQAHGVFGTAGNFLTMAFDAAGFDNATAQRMGSIGGFALKMAAFGFGIKALYDWVTTKGNGFWGGLWRVGVIATIGAMAGNDIMALFNGGKGGNIAKIIEKHIHDKDYFKDNEGSGSGDLLQFSFGSMPLQQFKEMLMRDSESGTFMLKPEEYKGLANNPSMTPEQKKMLSSLFGGSDGSVNQMINNSLKGMGISSMQDMDAKFNAFGGGRSLREYMQTTTQANTYIQDLEKVVGPMNQTDKDTFEKYINALPATEKANFVERMKEMNAFGKTWNDFNLLVGDHLMNHRKSIFNALPQVTALTTGFGQMTQVNALQQAFVYGQAPFTSTSKRSELETHIGALFANDPMVMSILSSNDVPATLNTVVAGWSVDFQKDATWDIAGTAGDDERFFTNIAGVTPGVLLGTKTLITGGSRVTFWIPNANGKYEERQIETIGGTTLDCTGLGFDATSKEFGLIISGAAAGTRERKYTTDMLENCISAAKSNPMATGGNLSPSAYNPKYQPNIPGTGALSGVPGAGTVSKLPGMSSQTPATEFTIRKTSNVRPK